MKTRWLCLVLLAATACPDPARVRDMGKATTAGAATVTTPSKMLAKCLRFDELRAACPGRVPRVDDGVRGGSYSFDHSYETGDTWGFGLQWGAPYEGLSPKNAPPRFAHLHLVAGNLAPYMSYRIEPSRGRSPHEVRGYGVGFGWRTWNGRRGELFLAPSYGMGGGSEGDHLVFRWTQGGRDYALSLHAWDRLDQTEATLEAIVTSMPPGEPGT